jgi:hypothetical protein
VRDGECPRENEWEDSMNVKRSIRGCVGVLLVTALVASCSDDDKAAPASVTQEPATTPVDEPDTTEAPETTAPETTAPETTAAADDLGGLQATDFFVCRVLLAGLDAAIPEGQWEAPEFHEDGTTAWCDIVPAGAGLSASIALTMTDVDTDPVLKAIEADPSLAEAVDGLGERAYTFTDVTGTNVVWVFGVKSMLLRLGADSEYLGSEVEIATEVMNAGMG